MFLFTLDVQNLLLQSDLFQSQYLLVFFLFFNLVGEVQDLIPQDHLLSAKTLALVADVLYVIVHLNLKDPAHVVYYSLLCLLLLFQLHYLWF